MNKKSKARSRYRMMSGVAQLFILVVVVILAVGGLLFYSWQKRLIDNVSVPITSKNDDIEIVEVSLDIKAPFTEAGIVINKEKTITYSAKYQEEQEETKSSIITAEQLESLYSLILEKDYFSLEEKPKNPGDPEDGSYYYISVKYYPGNPLEQSFPSHNTVYCYQFNCESAFLEIKDKIIKLWGDEVLEVGV